MKRIRGKHIPASVRAAEAIKVVRRARASSDAPEQRTGRDGKSYPIARAAKAKAPADALAAARRLLAEIEARRSGG